MARVNRTFSHVIGFLRVTKNFHVKKHDMNVTDFFKCELQFSRENKTCDFKWPRLSFHALILEVGLYVQFTSLLFTCWVFTCGFWTHGFEHGPFGDVCTPGRRVGPGP